MIPESYLVSCDNQYDAAECMLRQPFRWAGVHSTLEPGASVHLVRDSLHYALALCQAGGSGNLGRAADIVRRVVLLQDCDPLSRTYGIWPYTLEEPLEQMSPPDWNWADFCGARLAQILHDHAAQLTDEAVSGARLSLGHAAWSIFRRNVALEYTNIAIMGGGVAAAAGEILAEPRLLDYAQARLERVVELTAYHDSFPEYNSPTYTTVALEECERMLHLCRDARVRAAAEHLRQFCWQIIAEHFHPETQQWAAPQSRAYSDHLRTSVTDYLSDRIGRRVEVHPRMSEPEYGLLPSLVPPIPCPEMWRERFYRLPEAAFEIRRRLVRREDPERPPRQPVPRHLYGDRVGTTWFSGGAALGSVNHEDLWTQRRAVLAHLRTPADPAATLRLRFLHDGRDFASAFVRSAQQGPRVLSAVTFVTNRGDWHPYFDHPEGDIFYAEDFRLRYEMTGNGVSLEDAAGKPGFVLTAGDYRAVVHPVPGQFGDKEIHWESGCEEGRAWVDAVCYTGARHGFDLSKLAPVRIAVGLELLTGGETASPEPVQVASVDEGAFLAKWAGLQLHVPMAADVYPE